jgi:hypothetical protein
VTCRPLLTSSARWRPAGRAAHGPV